MIRDYELTHGRETDLSTIGVNHWNLEKWCKNTKNLMGINGYPPLWNTLLLACRAYNNSFRSSCRTGDFERALARGHVVGVYGCLLFSSTCHVDIGSHGAFVWDYIVYYIYIHIYIYISLIIHGFQVITPAHYCQDIPSAASYPEFRVKILVFALYLRCTCFCWCPESVAVDLPLFSHVWCLKSPYEIVWSHVYSV